MSPRERQTPSGRDPLTGPPTGPATRTVAADRTRSVGAARRHSNRVRLLKWGLPAAALLLGAGYLFSIAKTAGFGSGLANLELPRILPENLRMNNPRYEGFTKDGGAYLIAAEWAQQDLKNLDRVSLNAIAGDLTDAKKVKTKVTATRGTFDIKAQHLELFDAINIVSESGLKADLTEASVDTKEGLIESKAPVAIEMPSGTIRANQMTIRQKVNEITFLDAVTANLKPARKPVSAGLPAEPKSKPLFGGGDQPIAVTAARLDVNDEKKTALFTGDVKAIQGESTLAASELEVTYSGAATDTSGSADTAAKLERIVAKPSIVITQGANDRITGDVVEFIAASETAIVSGNVVMTSGPTRRVTADKAELDQRSDVALLTGNVFVQQGKNELRGRRLTLDRKTGRTHVASPGSGEGAGRVTARFFPSNPGAGKAQTVGDKTSGFGLTTFKTDPNAPVDILATTLDVNDQTKTAIFRGDVQATQGEFKIRSEELQAYYSGEAGIAGPQDGSAQKAAAQLTKIEARKKVAVTSKNGQSATGDWAVFDTKSNTVTLGGDVIITQDRNVARGTRLVIDMTTGQSTIDVKPGDVQTAPATAGSEANPLKTGRPSAVFYPNQAKDALKGQVGDVLGPRGSSSWSPATVAPQEPATPPGNN